MYHLARSLGVELGDLLDFSANINPLGFPPGLTGAVQEALTRDRPLPGPPLSWSCAHDLAAYHHLTPEEILVGNGSTELIYLVARALKPAGGSLSPRPSANMSMPWTVAGVPVAFHPTAEAHNFTLHEVPEPQAGDLVFLAHPASPSGVLLDPELFLAGGGPLRGGGGLSPPG